MRQTAIQRITPPTLTPITLAEAKQHLRVEVDDDNAVITALIEAATDYLDGWTGILRRALLEQTWELYLDAFPASDILLPLGPVSAITSVKYDDVDGVEQTVDADDYEVDIKNDPAWLIANESWPATFDQVNAVRVRFVVGYGNTAASVPPSIRQAIKLLVGHWYEHREEVVMAGQPVKLPMAAAALLAPHRMISL